MKHLFVLDPIEHINPAKASSAALMQAAQRALIEVWVCTPSDLQAHGDKAWVVTSSVISERRTIDINFQETTISTKGRHDPCVGIRAVPVVEAMLATTIADHCLRYF